MPVEEAARYRHNPFDLTKVWPYRDYPLIPIGRLVLDRLPDNYFAETEQAAFDPGNFVPGIGPSPDPMLQARLFAYGDAHRYRLGVNHMRLPVHAPRAALEEHDAERLFELRDLRAQRGLRDVAALGGAAKRALLGDGDHVLELAEREGMGRGAHERMIARAYRIDFVLDLPARRDHDRPRRRDKRER